MPYFTQATINGLDEACGERRRVSGCGGQTETGDHESRQRFNREDIPAALRLSRRKLSHEGSRPMAITWRLLQPMPTEVYQASTVAVA
jgi:hypothetical protein